MAIIYFDTETTALFPGQICQLAYIIEKGDTIYPKNFYFSVDSVDIGASKVNGLTVEKLINLSQGRVFGDDFEEIKEDFESASLLIAHNFRYDCTFMRAEFERMGRAFCFRESFCSMQGFKPRLRLPNNYGGYKNPSLNELAASYGVTKEEITEGSVQCFDTKTAAHDARFDTCALFFAIRKARDVHEDLGEYLLSKL